MKENRTPGRSWLRFGLRGLLVLLTIACIWLAVVFNQCRRQRLAIEAITKAGGIVGFDYQFESPSKDAPPPGPPWLRQIVGDELFRTPVHVEIRGEGIDDALLAKHLAGVQSTQFLFIQSDRVTDATLARLARLPNVDMLHLKCGQISDAGLAHLGSMKQLESLGIDCPRITDAGASHLSGLKSLEVLRLNSPQLTPDGIRRLKGLDRLRYFRSVRDPANDGLLEALRRPIDLDFAELPLIDVFEFMALTAGVNVNVDEIPADRRLTPVTLAAKGKPAEECLQAILDATSLDYYVQAEVVKITTPAAAGPRRAGARACQETFPSLDRLEVDW